MFLEYDWSFGVFRPRFGAVFTAIDGWRSFPDMETARYVLKGRGLKLGGKTDSRTWAIVAA
jgi:hypothetical protein